jgi:hypothetical protein
MIDRNISLHPAKSERSFGWRYAGKSEKFQCTFQSVIETSSTCPHPNEKRLREMQTATTENAPAGEPGRFWGYYREERYVSLYMWIRGRWVGP